MKSLSKEELLEIKAGGISWSAVGAIVGIVTFVIGLVDGFIRPLPCNE